MPCGARPRRAGRRARSTTARATALTARSGAGRSSWAISSRSSASRRCARCACPAARAPCTSRGAWPAPGSWPRPRRTPPLPARSRATIDDDSLAAGRAHRRERVGVSRDDQHGPPLRRRRGALRPRARRLLRGAGRDRARGRRRCARRLRLRAAARRRGRAPRARSALCGRWRSRADVAAGVPVATVRSASTRASPVDDRLACAEAAQARGLKIVVALRRGLPEPPAARAHGRAARGELGLRALVPRAPTAERRRHRLRSGRGRRPRAIAPASSERRQPDEPAPLDEQRASTSPRAAAMIMKTQPRSNAATGRQRWASRARR